MVLHHIPTSKLVCIILRPYVSGQRLLFIMYYLYFIRLSGLSLNKPPWRNWLARSAVNFHYGKQRDRKDAGSIPAGGEFIFFLFQV